jgi:hypothetical protein
VKSSYHVRMRVFNLRRCSCQWHLCLHSDHLPILYSTYCIIGCVPPPSCAFARVQSPFFGWRRSGQRGRSGRAPSLVYGFRPASSHLISSLSSYVPLNMQPSTIRLRFTESVDHATQVLALTSDDGAYLVTVGSMYCNNSKRGETDLTYLM